MLTPEMMEFAKVFGFPALLVVAGGWAFYKIVMVLMSTHLEYVKESKSAITEVTAGLRTSNEAMKDNLDVSRAIAATQAQHTRHLEDIRSGLGCKAKS